MSAEQPEPTEEELRAAYEAEIKHWLEYDTSGSDRLFRLLMEPLLTFGYRQRAYGIENIPATGAFLMAANHSSYMDPFFYARPQGRFLRFMARIHPDGHASRRCCHEGGWWLPRAAWQGRCLRHGPCRAPAR